MRYALISDIHGNLEALEAVLADLKKERITAYLCLGDIIGYGANPKECIEKVKSLRPEILIAGNHEWGVLGLLELSYFNEQAASAIEWTGNVIDGGDAEYLKTFKLSSSDKCMTLVHGSLEEPKEFFYIFDANDTDKTFRLLKTKICFVGHSHVPGIFSFDGKKPAKVKGMNVKLDNDKKYLVNIGSVGQPRDGDPRASFAIYDARAGAVEIRRVPYDIRSAQAKIIAAGLPPLLASRLAEGH
ncbi:MAG: metallophosphoesterase family protein [Candidatus Omnitrophica bacterium]|nr:metallophosphoesterase family protein [Candidatus Omnitrophota bacterium]